MGFNSDRKAPYDDGFKNDFRYKGDFGCTASWYHPDVPGEAGEKLKNIFDRVATVAEVAEDKK